jgi:IS30 family transposase
MTAELWLSRSPVAICADRVADEVEIRVCVETIYVAVFAGVLEVKATECLQSRQPHPKRPTARYESNRPALPNITIRPAAVDDRNDLGHWEGNQIIGRRNRSPMLWLTERITR